MHIIIEECLQIVERIVFEYGNGKMPPDRRALIALLMNKFAVPENVAADLRSRISVAEWEEARRHFATGLVAACDIFERDARSQFLN